MIPSPRVDLQRPGSFVLGCNYWASHAGTAMWSDWRPEVVDADFAALARHGVRLLRIFPLWPDFQPITQLRAFAGTPVEIRFREEPLPDTPAGQCGVDEVMLSRLNLVCALAERHGLKLIVGIVTGWMSGRLFVPPALEGRDPITDPVSLVWQTRLIRAVVTHARAQSAIYAWDLGNECNCLGHAPTREAAALWTATLSGAVRSADSTRPLISGMHALATAISKVPNPWRIEDQAEFTDLLTTHPYPYWSRHTRQDPVNALRTTFHATAETRFYADIGGKPCFAEEIGSMGPMVAGDVASAEFARVNLFSLWANDCRGFLWWCNHDQTLLAHAPYDWNGVELELGLFRADGTPKPVLGEMHAFDKFLRAQPEPALPPRVRDGVCLLSHNQDDWAEAYGTYALAKQAGLELEFRHIQQAIPDAQLYLLPGLAGANAIPRRKWLELLARVKAGATLYVSLADGIVPGFNAAAGVELLTRAAPTAPLAARLDGLEIPLPGGDDLRFRLAGAELLAARSDDSSLPMYWVNNYGKGRLFILAAPLESSLATRPGALESGPSAESWRFYAPLAARARAARWFPVDSPVLAATEHPLPDGGRLVIVINHSAEPVTLPARPTDGHRLLRLRRGLPGPRLVVPPHDAVVLELVPAPVIAAPVSSASAPTRNGVSALVTGNAADTGA